MSIINGIKEGLLKAEFAMSSAMESASNEILHVQNEDDKNSISISQHVATKSVYEALLRGEITQEVIDFRYHLYLLSAKIDDYRGILNEDGSARVERVVVDKPLYVEENDMGYDTVLIQGIKTIDLDDDINVLNSYMSGCKPDNRISTLAITRKFKPIYKTEIWAKRVVLKKNSDGEYIMDLYFENYKDSIGIELDGREKNDALFRDELNRVLDGKSSEIYDFDEVYFITNRPWGDNSGCEYRLKNTGFISAKKSTIPDTERKKMMDTGLSILKFHVEPVVIGYPLSEKYESVEEKERYDTNAPRQQEKKDYVLSPFNSFGVCKCEACGRDMVKEVKDNCTSEIDDGEAYAIAQTDFDESKRVYGRGLCRKCLKEILF